MAARENRKIRGTTRRRVQYEKEQREKEARERAGEKSKGETGGYESRVRSEAPTYSGASSRILGTEIFLILRLNVFRLSDWSVFSGDYYYAFLPIQAWHAVPGDLPRRSVCSEDRKVSVHILAARLFLRIYSNSEDI
jgi:hypothetical protein